MQIQINIDRNIEGHEALAAQVSGAVQSALNPISERITEWATHAGTVASPNLSAKRRTWPWEPTASAKLSPSFR